MSASTLTGILAIVLFLVIPTIIFLKNEKIAELENKKNIECEHCKKSMEAWQLFSHECKS